MNPHRIEGWYFNESKCSVHADLSIPFSGLWLRREVNTYLADIQNSSHICIPRFLFQVTIFEAISLSNFHSYERELHDSLRITGEPRMV